MFVLGKDARGKGSHKYKAPEARDSRGAVLEEGLGGRGLLSFLQTKSCFVAQANLKLVILQTAEILACTTPPGLK